jgi:hypothetical protein
MDSRETDTSYPCIFPLSPQNVDKNERSRDGCRTNPSNNPTKASKFFTLGTLVVLSGWFKGTEEYFIDQIINVNAIKEW